MASRPNLDTVAEHVVVPPEFNESRLTIVAHDQDRDLEANKENAEKPVDGVTSVEAVDSEKPFKANVLHGGEGESAIPEDKYTEALERMDKNWEHDADNPRNWTLGRKWKITATVCTLLFDCIIESITKGRFC